jgi:hypothetical protein
LTELGRVDPGAIEPAVGAIRERHADASLYSGFPPPTHRDWRLEPLYEDVHELRRTVDDVLPADGESLAG